MLQPTTRPSDRIHAGSFTSRPDARSYSAGSGIPYTEVWKEFIATEQGAATYNLMTTLDGRIAQISDELRNLRGDFSEALKNLQPVLLSINSKMSSIPGRGTIWAAVSAVIMMNIALFGAFLAAGAPKEVWLAVLQHFNAPVALNTPAASPSPPVSLPLSAPRQ